MKISKTTLQLILIGIVIMLFSSCSTRKGFYSANQLKKAGYNVPFTGTHYVRVTSDSTKANVYKP